MCCIVVGLYVFFFRQKTAYEMRISDWSSDVCSSDLKATATALPNDGGPTAERASQRASLRAATDPGGEPLAIGVGSAESAVETENRDPDGAPRHGPGGTGSARRRRWGDSSEENTSELPSLMLIPYAVLRMKKKKK